MTRARREREGWNDGPKLDYLGSTTMTQPATPDRLGADLGALRVRSKKRFVLAGVVVALAALGLVALGFVNRGLQSDAVTCAAGWLAKPPPNVTRDPHQRIWCMAPELGLTSGFAEGEPFDAKTRERLKSFRLLLDADEFVVDASFSLSSATSVPVSVRHADSWAVVHAVVARDGTSYRVVGLH